VLVHRFKRSAFALHGRLLERRHGEVVPTRHGQVTAPPEWIPPHKRSRINLGRYEHDESMFVKKYLDPSTPTIELGCGVGVVSSTACHMLRPDVAFVGLEGNPSLVPVAQRNIDEHPATATRKIVHGVAVGTEAESSTFGVTEDDFQISSVGSSIGDTTDASANLRTVEVPAKTLSQLLAENDFADYQLICDIEGAEADLLRNDRDAFARCQAFICELHGPELTGTSTTIADLVELITALGMRQLDERRGVFVFTRAAD